MTFIIFTLRIKNIIKEEQINKIFNFKYFEEECCDKCHETVHIHFKCPVCKEQFSGTSMYGEISMYYDDGLDIYKKFNCQICKSEYQIIKKFLGYNIKLISIYKKRLIRLKCINCNAKSTCVEPYKPHEYICKHCGYPHEQIKSNDV